MKLVMEKRREAIFPALSVHYAVEVGILIAKQIEARAPGNLIPVLVQQINGVPVFEVLEHHEITGELRSEIGAKAALSLDVVGRVEALKQTDAIANVLLKI